MRLPSISNLYGRIFAIFWFTIFLVLMAVTVITSSDPRDTHSAHKNNIEMLEKVTDKVERRYRNAPTLAYALSKLTGRYEKDYRGEKGRKDDRDDWDDRDDKPWLYFTDLSGNVVGNYGRMQMRAVNNFVTSLDSFEHPQQRQYGRFLLIGPAKVTIARQQVLMYIGTKVDQSAPFLLQLLDSPVSLLLTIMLTSTPLLLWLAWALSQPARRLEKAALRVANGEFAEDPELEKGSSEFRAAGAAFNQMVTAVNGMISGNQRLLSDISHELRSPLTRLRMASALATRKQGESSELMRIETEAGRLEKMIGELLELSRMQVNSHQVREECSAEELWLELVKDAEFEAEQVGKQLGYTSIPDCRIKGNPNLLMSAVENIIRNAIHYSEDRIEVSFAHAGSSLVIQVADNGEGVPDSELDEIFRPFYRVSEARDRNSGGAGLGLAITESAVRQHNGSIKASRSKLGGLQVEIRLPVQG